jgi:predicted nucleic acid-binding protein
MADVVLDACVLIDLERRDRRTELWIEEAVLRGSSLLVAGATYTEVWKGYAQGKGYGMQRVLKSVVPIPTSESIGRRAGEILAEAGASMTLRFDAIVVATAAARNADVLTDDLDDIEYLGAYGGVRVLGTQS